MPSTKINVIVTYKDGVYRTFENIISEDWGTTENRFLVYRTETGRIHIKKNEIRSVEETNII